MLTIRTSGSFKNTEAFLKRMSSNEIMSVLNKYGQIGVNALAQATPVKSGATAAGWGYEVVHEGNTFSIYWTNDNMAGGTPVAILLQYGHGTGTGGYVAGRNYINPSIKPVFDKIADEVWKAVTSA